MVKGLDTFRRYFADYEEQYVLIGGAACDILFESNEVNFRATRDLDMVLIVEALTPEFGEKFWKFIVDGKYRNKATNGSNPQFYRFDKPEEDKFPKMIELFCRSDFELKSAEGITPIHIDDEVSSLSAILLNDDYYKALLNGKVIRNGLSVLKPEYIILFKAKAYLDLKSRKDLGEKVDSSDIKKHKKDILRIASELILEKVEGLYVNQSIVGRILNYGTITVSGTGGLKTPIRFISNPIYFRNVFNEFLEHPQNLIDNKQ